MAAFADDGLVAVGEAVDELLEVLRARSCFDFGLRRIRPCIEKVVANARVEQKGVLEDDPEVSAQRIELDLPKVLAIDPGRALGRVLETSR